jgi:branched-chain amino acid transport system permease protein
MPPLIRRLLVVVAVVGALYWLDLFWVDSSGGSWGFLESVLPDAAWRSSSLFAMVNVVIALSLNIINGMAGQFSIGHAGFVGIGAYTGAIVASHVHVELGTEDIPCSPARSS